MSEEKEKPHIPLHRERMGIPDNEEAKKLREQKIKQLKDDCRVTFSPPAGRRVLRYLMNIAGYKKSKVGGNPQLGMDVQTGTLYNAARELVILEMIDFIPQEVLRDVEFGTWAEIEE
jgi:hypothetical protein